VVIVDRADDPRAAGADVTAVFDVYYKFDSNKTALMPLFILPPLALALLHSTAKTDMTVALLGAGGAPIDTLKADGVVEHRGPTDQYHLMGDSMRIARTRLERALLSSGALEAYARARKPAPSAATAARAAPAYHSDVDAPSYAAAPEDGDAYALVIGVENYEGLPKADFAERDAAAVKAHLLALGYPERNVVLLTGQRAGRASIAKYVESWLPSRVTEDSRVFVYFSGHGAPDAATGRAYLVPWDGDPKFLENTAYPIQRLYRKLNALKAKSVVVAMDACFSGAGGRSVLAKGARPLVTKVDVGQDDLGKVVSLAAAGAGEITGTDETQGHGLFTYFLLHGLNASRGRATVQSLYDELLPLVRDAARRDNRDQTPQLLASAGAAAKLSLSSAR
ncbi:MAG: caspase family protein, partial [Elusimicrobia bacterium]|nr:caspase family protein [Elusimicrobiota bacterium]